MFKPVSVLLPVSALALMPAAVHAQDSLSNLSKASGDSVVAAGQMSEAGVNVVAGAVALPFIVAGGASEGLGGSVRESGEAVWDDANGPLDISPETLTAQPAPQVPYEAQRRRDPADN